MEVRFIPLVSGQLTMEHVEQTKAALAEMPKPILAHCASGMRSAILWSRADKGEMTADAIINAVGKAGYDLAGLRPNL